MGEANKPSIWPLAPAAIRADCGFRTVIPRVIGFCGLPRAVAVDYGSQRADRGRSSGAMSPAARLIPPFPRCAACGEVVGVYERAVMVLEGGGLAHGSLLALNDRDARDLYHEPCFPLRAAPE
jgi:hypothetical protein